eukprot:CAMPEP_0194370546 /NCGR_PEP_ID=MMETSP0174-20130528/18851_1 /TAXON_ID=216777 /ORGANISM="Proboscia alata, Strain PI-D3" /LENGTH=293 /DNA_ID=CAMNT_0039148065 /DNA_START=61 /DNA_END=942 /DNA_ORIENTATION=+
MTKLTTKLFKLTHWKRNKKCMKKEQFSEVKTLAKTFDGSSESEDEFDEGSISTCSNLSRMCPSDQESRSIKHDEANSILWEDDISCTSSEVQCRKRIEDLQLFLSENSTPTKIKLSSPIQHASNGEEQCHSGRKFPIPISNELLTRGKTKYDFKVSEEHKFYHSPIRTTDRNPFHFSLMTALESPVTGLESPATTLENSANVLECPMSALDNPVSVLDSPVSVLENPIREISFTENKLKRMRSSLKKKRELEHRYFAAKQNKASLRDFSVSGVQFTFDEETINRRLSFLEISK